MIYMNAPTNTKSTYSFQGFSYDSLAEAEEARTNAGENAYHDGRRKCIWGPDGKAY